MKIIFVDCDGPLKAAWDRIYRADDPPVTINMEPFPKEKIPEIVKGHGVVIVDHSFFTDEVMGACPDLRFISFLGTGAASYIDLAAAKRRGIGVSTIKGYGDVAVAEHNVALMFAAAREVARQDRLARQEHWEPREGMQLRGKTIGLVGMGGIGSEVARICAGIGMEVIAWNRSPRDVPGVRMTSLDEVLAKSDVLSIHLTLSDETKGFIDSAKLMKTKPGVILVNTARGAIVDEPALVAGLRTGRIRHAALDVFNEEPLPAGHPFKSLDNVTITAHSGFSTPDSLNNLLRRALDNAIAAVKQG